jgi:PIN domain nuclease of toxin-antitoxin system
VILLDTHAVIWLLLAPDQLSKRARGRILEARIAGEKIACSPISLYEMAFSAFKERVQLPTSTEDFIAAVQAKVELAPFTARIALCAAELPAPFHGDPMDRIITATALVANCTLITKDEKIRDANLCKVIW